jgi:hypothetical protein
MNSTIEMNEQDEKYWPEFIFGFETEDEEERCEEQ